MRLLVATEFPPNASGGGPAVVRQMLRGWPKADLCWWSCLPERDRRFGQEVSSLNCAAIPSKLMPHHRLTRAKSLLLDLGWSRYAAGHLNRTIRRLEPAAIWVIPHNWSILPFAAVLPGASTGFHVTMQDYANVHGQADRFGQSLCLRMARSADRLYATATTRDATSHPMVEDLQQRTGAPAVQMLHAGLEESDFEFLASKKSNRSSEIRIAYAGTILASKEFTLFVEALKQVRAHSALPLSLELFGAHTYASKSWFDSRWMREHGDLAEPELLAALRDCTWGFAPMSLTDDDPRYNRFSFPTKFISYLMAGLPVVALGHHGSSLIKMAGAYRVGLVTETNDTAVLAQELAERLADPDPWARYGGEIVRCAREEFDATAKRKVLHECFARCEKATQLQRAAKTRR